jgi:hypothetical protein
MSDVDLKEVEEVVFKTNPYEFQKNQVWSGGSIIYEFAQKFYSGEISLTTLRVPTFCVKPIPFLEQHADFSYPFKYLRKYKKQTFNTVRVSEEKDQLERVLMITQHFVTTGKLGPCFGFAGIAPHMPLVGEHFSCSWEHKDSTTYFVGEQVTEDILVSSIENPKKNISLINCGSKKGGFWGNSAGTYSKGGAKLTLTNLNGQDFSSKFLRNLLHHFSWRNW